MNFCSSWYIGAPDIASSIPFSLVTSLKVDPPVFTLTCVSTGGPATTVTWTQDGAVVLYNSNHVLTQTVTDQSSATYSNVLTVTGREPGIYQCRVANDRENDSSQFVEVEGMWQHTRLNIQRPKNNECPVLDNSPPT